MRPAEGAEAPQAYSGLSPSPRPWSASPPEPTRGGGEPWRAPRSRGPGAGSGVAAPALRTSACSGDAPAANARSARTVASRASAATVSCSSNRVRPTAAVWQMSPSAVSGWPAIQCGVTSGQRAQRGPGARGQQQAVPGRRRRGGRRQRRLLHDHMGVDAAQPERAHPGAPRLRAGRPRPVAPRDTDRQPVSDDVRIELPQVQVRRNLAVVQRQHQP